MEKTLIRSELKLDLEKYKRNLIRKEAEINQAVLQEMYPLRLEYCWFYSWQCFSTDTNTKNDLMPSC
jgi:hypothetical protein